MFSTIGNLLGLIAILVLLTFIGIYLAMITGIIGYLVRELTGQENQISKLINKIVEN